MAGEYVLGTLDEAERRAAELRRATDGAFAAEIRAWETRLAPLARTLAPVAPPAVVWRRLEAAIASPRPDVARMWRRATFASLALAAALAVALLAEPGPGPAVPLAALVPIGAQDASFVAERAAGGTVLLRPLRPVRVPSDRDLELWAAVAGRAAPVALGVLPVSGRRLAANALPEGTTKLLVSLEPKGGSPTGLPTGPVLFAGSLRTE